MDEKRIEEALRAGSPDDAPYPEGAFARGLAERERHPAATMRIESMPRRGFSMATAGFLVIAVVVGVAIVSLVRPGTTGSPRVTEAPGVIASARPTPSGASAVAPDATASSAASASGIGDGLPAVLVDRWVGLLRSPDGPVTPAAAAVLDIRGAELRVGPERGNPADVSISALTPSGPGELRLTSIGSTGGCDPYDEGHYRWSLSPASSRLTLELIADGCPARKAALTGEWTHTACRDATQDCLGPVEAGTYDSMALDLDRSSRAAQLQYTLPDGWANTSDHPMNFALRPAADYAADPGVDGGDTASGIYIWAGTLAAAQPADCAGIAAPGVEPTAASIADYFRTLPGLNVDDQGTMSIDGRTALVLDLSIDPNFTGTCPWAGGMPFRSLVTFADGGADRGVWGLMAGEQARVILVDAAPGRVASIWVDGGAAQLPSLIDQSMPIIESFRLPAATQP